MTQKEFRQIIQNIIGKIIEANKASEQPQSLIDFIKKFYANHPIENLDPSKYTKFYNMAAHAFAFLQKRTTEASQIRIFNPSEELCGYQSKNTIIEIINNDMPFLIDSLKEELNRLGIKIFEITHPILSLERNANGEFVQFRSDNGEDVKIESFIHIHVSRLNENQFDNVVEHLTHTFTNVQITVEDWKIMLGEVEMITDEIQSQEENDTNKEIVAFLDWLSKNNFTFLGYKNFASNTKFGVLRTKVSSFNSEINTELDNLATNLSSMKSGSIIDIGKLNKISPLHKHTNLDYVAIRTKDNNLVIFIGLFATNINYQTVTNIPIIRKKVAYVMETSGFLPATYNYKELLSILESLPKWELFQINANELFNMAIGVFALISRPKVKLFVRKDNLHNFISCLVFLPKERLNSSLNNKIHEILSEDLGSEVSTSTMQVTDLSIAYLHVILNTGENTKLIENISETEAKIRAAISFFDEEFKQILASNLNFEDADIMHKKYRDSFPAAYVERFGTNHILEDIHNLESLNHKNIAFNIYKPNNSHEHAIHLKIYSAEKIILSDFMPIIDNMGFRTDEEYSFEIDLDGKKKLWMHDFNLTISAYETHTIAEVRDYAFLLDKEIKKYAEEALDLIISGKMQNDSLNKLILRSAFTSRQVFLLSAISKYIKQTNFSYSIDYFQDVLTRHPDISKLLVNLFYSKFDPEAATRDQASTNKIETEIMQRLSKVTVSAEDAALRAYIGVIKAILRTNFFQKNAKGEYKEYISFKLESKKVPGLPLPLPYAEIFVFSARVEGIHLRGGKVARGGLRWSDRSEDFRTEVLGLMKAQMTKNAVIVPVGSKGGFYVKGKMALIGREAYMQEGKECYKTFLRGLLDITDNIVGGKIVPPVDVIRLDGDDPYLVVAADKGTATFSDIANSISKEYGFWLDDAFASGGSVGYDHKKMGITAKGGWISVVRHFNELGIDISKEEFTTVGIGDMAGDVFGNGMLLSNNIKLIAAFNHMHIFVDPNPDSKTSFKERERLFNLPTSTWMDYNAELISKGGKIFDRREKSLTLTPEIKAALDIEQDEVTPEELMTAILKAKVDLLWNGGIGTYIKATSENHMQVGDKANDAIRVNGKDLRCKIVAEGGNLGATQFGRIEYSMNGGKINTDFIDNSAGVDCSDHEVNIKIAFSKALESGKITLEERDSLLAEMTNEVAQLVLKDNRLQTQALTLSEQQKYSTIELNARLIDNLEEMGVLNREVEFLPSKEEIAKRAMNKQGLTRPELAVLLSYSKITIYNDLIKSSLPDEAFFYKDLLSYFPVPMREKFEEEIAGHQLRREIIVTMVTNSMVNRIGSFLYNFAQEDTGCKGCDVARAYVITRELFDLRDIWRQIEDHQSQVSVETYVELFNEVYKLIQRCIFWLVRNATQILDVTEIIKNFKPKVLELMENIETTLSGRALEKYNEKLDRYNKLNLKGNLAKNIAKISVLSSSLDIVSVAHKYELSINMVASIYFKVGARFRLDSLRQSMDKMSFENYWSRLSAKSIRDELYDLQRELTAEIVKSSARAADPVASWVDTHIVQIERYDEFIKDMFEQENIDFSMLVVAAKRVHLLSASI